MDSIGGYRLVRSLGTGVRAEVWLGHGGSNGPEHGIAAVKVFRPGVPLESVDAEIEALGRASGRHLIRLDDLAMAPDGVPCLILQRLSTVSLGRILVGNQALQVGEAVTVLAPLAMAVAELHRVGVAHGAIRPSSVLFDDAGAPVLACFGSAQLFGEFPTPPQATSMTPAALAEQLAVSDDLDQLAALCRLVLEQVVPEQASGAASIAQWLDTTDRLSTADRLSTTAIGGRPDSFAAELADRLFSLGEPQPVRFERARFERSLEVVPPRLGGYSPVIAEVPVSPAPRAPSGWMAVLHLPDWLSDAIEDKRESWLDAGPVLMLRNRVRQVLGPVRKPVWIAAGAVALCFVAVIALVPQGSGTAATVDGDSVAATASPAPSYSTAVDPAVTGDDPVAAARALLTLRAACIRELSVLCLDTSDQQGSAAMDADGHLIRTAQQGGVAGKKPDLAGAEVTLVERLGDSALLVIAPQSAVAGMAGASLLLVRVDAGWRIRDLVIGDSSIVGEESAD